MDRYVEASTDRVSALQHIRDEIELLLGIADRWDENHLSIFLCHAAESAEAALLRAGTALVEI